MYNETFNEYNLCFNNSPLAFCIIQFLKDKSENIYDFLFCYANNAFAEIEGKEINKIVGKNFSEVYPYKDKKAMQVYSDIAFGGGTKEIKRYNHENNKYLKVQCYQIKEGLCGCLVTDITSTTFDVDFNNTNVLIWEYDIINHCIFRHKKAEDSSDLSFITENSINLGLIHPESIDDYKELYADIENGKSFSAKDIHMYDSNKNDAWYRLELKTVFDDDMNPVRAIGCGINITEYKKLEFQYNSELESLAEQQDKNLLVKFSANITTNTVDYYKCQGNTIPVSINDGYAKMVEYIAELCTTDDMKKRYIYEMSPDYLLKLFEKGISSHSIEYKRKMKNNTSCWVSANTKLFREPYSNNIICFCYVYDINKEKINRYALREVVKRNYDFVGVIDCYSKQFTCLINTLNANIMNGNYEKVSEYSIIYYKLHFKDEAEYLSAVQSMSLDNIKNELLNKKIFSFNMKVWNSDHTVLHTYIVNFTYLDNEKTQILTYRTDITASLNEEMYQRENLRCALEQAQQASHAKSNFLSRMSHEIRTPMNAIIGMSALAAQCVNDPEQVSDCISKVGISARFLLSLINDILDMSRIESGKVTVKNEEFPFEELIGGINTIVYEQAAEKNIDYDCVITSFTDTYYMGDAMKIQQILLNLLGNAIKFTPNGGKVQLLIHQRKIDNEKAYMTFTVNDTGVGISDEFQKKLFEPFEQQYSATTSPYSGTGLGLAICKNLVSLMNGKITVNSIEGIGSEFTVDIALGLCKEKRRLKADKNDFQVNKLEVLIVDDDVMICEHTQSILNDMGIKAEWVDRGSKAVEMVRFRYDKQKSFDVILIDWKMPDMDGIETTKRIRKIVGPDVTIIVMTAYDWSSIEYEAKAAGVNLLISKPLFKSSLISAFEKIYSKKTTNKIKKEQIVFDFTGKRILLVEDHILNVEVARRLLTSKGAEVEVAENGLAAIEIFTTAPTGHFDVILMDIRMPVMDGLTAARSIRQLKKENARSIPIIAMSANAFDEDIEKSRAAGMNGHLAKPIEPQLLYETLQQFFL